jgi:hypothetical protein
MVPFLLAFGDECIFRRGLGKACSSPLALRPSAAKTTGTDAQTGLQYTDRSGPNLTREAATSQNFARRFCCVAMLGSHFKYYRRRTSRQTKALKGQLFKTAPAAKTPVDSTVRLDSPGNLLTQTGTSNF